MRARRFLALMAGLVACGGQRSDTTPEPEEGARPSSDGVPDGVRPCDGYVERGLLCAVEEEEAAGWSREPGDREGLEARLRDECRFWLESGATREEIDGALRGCEAVSCSGGSIAWTSCLAEGLPAAAADHGWTPSSPSEWTRIEPRPIPSDVPPCETYTAWTIDCLRNTMGRAAFDAAVGEAMNDSMREACDAYEQAGVGGLLLPALAACADVGCGADGTDLVICIANELIGAMTGGSGGVP